jgi:hypothetical protein
MSRIQRRVPRDSNLDYRRFPVVCEEFLPLRSEECVSHMLIELGPIGKVVIEAIG